MNRELFICEIPRHVLPPHIQRQLMIFPLKIKSIFKIPLLPNPHNNQIALILTFKMYSKGSFYFLFWLSKQQKGTIKLPSIAVTKIISLANIYYRPICIQHSFLFCLKAVNVSKTVNLLFSTILFWKRKWIAIIC